MKRILSLAIVLTLLLGTVTTAFAANLDLINQVDEAKSFSWNDFIRVSDNLRYVGENIDDYLIEYNKQYYSAKELDETTKDGTPFLEAIEKLEPVEEPVDELKVVEVSAINSTAIKVVFNQKVEKKSAENLANYYIGIGDSKVDDSSIAANNKDGETVNYKAVLQEDGRTVIISANTDPKHVIWVDKNSTDVIAGAKALKVNATDSVVKNKTVTIQVRNVKTAAGKLMDTQEKSFKAVDNTPATIYGATKDTDGNIIRNDDNVSEVVVTSDEDVYFTFDEPVFVDTDVKFYLDSRNITQHVTQDLTVDPSGKTLKVDKEAGIKDLTLGNHKFEAVGVEDLAGNKPVGDIYNAIIKVVEPEDDVTEDEAPVVESLVQTEEGKFVVTFKVAPKIGTKIVVKDSEGNTVVDNETMLSDGTTAAVSISGTKATVKFAEKMVDYKGSTKLIYTVEVTGADGGKIEAATGSKKADKYSKVHTFKLDLVAPEVVYSTKDAKGKVVETEFVKNTDLGKIVIPFKDEPFNGKVVKGTSANAVILKQHIGEETKSLTIPFEKLQVISTDNVLTIDIATLASDNDIGAAAKAMLNKDSNALLAGEYELILPRGLVEDTDDKRLSDNDTVIPFAGDTVKFEVKEAGQGGGVSVPQTAQDLVEYDENHDAIIVKFVGEDIKASTAKNPANYTLAGKKLAANTYIEYETLKDEDGKVTGGEARIFLNKDTIVRDGNYTLKVEGVSTNSGAKMLPVTVTVKGMKDNTRPVLESAVITGDAKLELRFSESVEIEDKDLAAGNFEVLVDGAVYNVKEANVHETNDRLVILELRDIVDYTGKTVVIRTKADKNNDYFVRDLGGNELKAGVTVTAAPLGE